MQPQNRYLHQEIQTISLSRGKMAFISGPRQVGKTTLALSYEEDFDEFSYKNWDELAVKRAWSKDPNLLIESFHFSKLKSSRLLVLDEIHKAKGWKSRLKGLYDTQKDHLSMIVTGCTRLNVYKKGSDSLLGRYYHFRLHPFSIRDAHQMDPMGPDELEKILFHHRPTSSPFSFKIINDLFERSGFPEPYLSSSPKIRSLWQKGRKEKIIREDLRDLSRIQEISQIEILCDLLPEKVGSPLSVQSLREDLSVSHDTTTRWLLYLKELYYFFDVTPYSKSIARSLRKEAKVYLYDWTEVRDEGARFENFVASHLLKACHYWEDTGEGLFQLHYLRDKDKNEIDFIILRDKKPWFTVECKLHDKNLGHAYKKFQPQVNCPHIQVVFEEGVFQKVNDQTWIMGVDFFLGHLV